MGSATGARSPTDELDNAAYRRNDGDRCYWCKDALDGRARRRWPRPSGATVVLGVNLDDLGDHRPGQRAAAAAGRVFPLVDAGFTKADVRAWSRGLGLRTWDKPAAACLASRVPYGTPVTVGVLDTVERAEAGAARRSASATCGCATTATWPASRCRSTLWRRVVDAAGRGRGRGPRRRLPLRDARPRGPALRQPQRARSPVDSMALATTGLRT